MIFRLWRLGVALTGILPVRVSYAVAAFAAEVVWWCLPVQRGNATDTMLHVVGRRSPRRARRLARRSFNNYARYAVDFMRQPRMDISRVQALVDFDEWSRISAAFTGGSGVIFVLTHFGNWDIGAAVLAARGYQVNAVVETQGNGDFNRALVEARAAPGVKLIPMERAAAGIIRALKRNQALAILIDRPLGEGGVEVEFFDARTRVPAGPARIALRTGASVVPVSFVRLSGHSGRVRAIVDFDVSVNRTGDNERDVQALTQRVMQAHECVIRQYPDQWYMFRRFWPSSALPNPSLLPAVVNG